MSRAAASPEPEPAAPQGAVRLTASWPPEARRAHAWLRFFAVALCAQAALFGAATLAPHVAASPFVAYGVGFSAVVGQTIASAWACPRIRRRELALWVLPAAGLLVAVFAPLPELWTASLVTAVWLFGGTLLGAAVGAAVEQKRHLLFVAIVSGIADCVSLLHPGGLSATIAKSEVALSLLALPWPMLGTSQIEPFLGAGDVVFTALYVASSRRHALPLLRTLLALTFAYGVTMVLVIALARAVPVLPLLGLAVVLAQPETRS